MDTVFITALIVGVGLGIVIAYLASESYFDSIWWSVVLCLVISLVIWLAGGEELQPKEMISYDTKHRHLITIADHTNGVFGSFFLGIGSISGGELRYYGFEEISPGKFKKVEFPMDITVVVEDIDSTDTPYFTQIRKKTDPAKLKEALKNAEWAKDPVEEDEFCNWEIHVPKGAIIRDFNIDLK